MRRTLNIGLLVLLVLLGGTAGLLSWLLYTDAGAAWLWARAQGALPGRLAAATMEGSVRGGVVFTGLRYGDEGVTVGVDRLAFAIDPDLIRPAVTIEDLQADAVNVAVAGGDDEAAGGPSLRELLSALELPLPLRVRNAQVRDLAVTGDAGASLFAATTVRLDGSLHDSLRIDHLAVAAGGVRATLSADLGLSAPFRVAASADVDAAGRPPPAPLPQAASASVEGTLDRLDVVVDGRQPALHIDGSIRAADTLPVFDLSATAARLPLGDVEAPPLVLREVTIALSGPLSDYRADVTAQLETAVAAVLGASANARGDLGGLDVSRLTLESTDVTAELSGRVGWSDGLFVAADIGLERLDPARWVEAWPAGETLRGRLNLEFDGARLAADGVHLAHRDAVVRGRGVVDFAAGIVELDLGSANLQWPPAPAEPRLSSPEARLTASGTPSDWRFTGAIALTAPDLPQGRFDLSGAVSPARVDVSILDSRVLGGHITGSVALEREAGSRWTAALETAGIELAPLLPDWPGRISAVLDASGRVEPFELELDIRELDGEVRTRPVAAQGRLLLRGSELRFADLRLRSGESRIALDGAWQSPGGVTFDVDIDALSDFVPATSGQLQGSGRLAAGRPWPLVSGELRASNLGWQDWSADALRVANRPVDASRPFALEAAADGLQLGARRIDALRATLTGSHAEHRLELGTSLPEGSADIELAGSLGNPADLSAISWDGSLEALGLQASDGTTLRLRDPAELELGRAGLRLAQACLEATPAGTVCLGGRWSSAKSYAARVDLVDFPLDLLRAASGAELEFTQRLDGSVSLATGPSGRASGDGRVEVSAGVIRNPYDERLNLPTRSGFAAFELDDGRLLFGEISLPFSDAAEVAGTFRVLDVARGIDSPIDGRLTARVRDIGVAARIVPQIDEAAGRLEANLAVDGTLGTPRFAGGMTLEDGRVTYDPLGFRLENVQIDSSILPGNRVELDSTFDLGGGSGRLRSSADYLEGQSGGFEVALTGTDLRPIDLEDLMVTVNPDLEVGVRGNRVQVNGRVVVPAARLASVKFITAGVSESDDVEIVGEEQPVDAEPPATASPLDWRGQVELELGDRVAIELDVAEARLGGTATYRWAGPPMPLASGGFDVSGRFEAYGQLLEITEGSIRYADVPANNPQLRIRAERDIFGNSQVRRAGVFVSGTALKPSLEVYTTPATTRERALTLLATGSDFDFEQGVGAVDVGTYIAPDLYASYGIGLFDRENVISVRYDLARGFGVKATSGKRAAGIDISYTIQR